MLKVSPVDYKFIREKAVLVTDLIRTKNVKILRSKLTFTRIINSGTESKKFVPFELSSTFILNKFTHCLLFFILVKSLK